MKTREREFRDKRKTQARNDLGGSNAGKLLYYDDDYEAANTVIRYDKDGNEVIVTKSNASAKGKQNEGYSYSSLCKSKYLIDLKIKLGC